MASAARVLRLKRTDKPSQQHILVHISQTSSSNPLDLKLVATEHEHLYHASIEERNVKSLQTSKYEGDLAEWKSILKYTLLHEQPPDPSSLPSLAGVETVAAITAQTLTITIRKNVEGITQRLGSIKLDQDDEREEVSAFEWVDLAVSHSDTLRTELEAVKAEVSAQRDEVAKLREQLDELVRAKREHEEEMVGKFARVLNSKKAKIRDLLRVLANAKVDGRVAEAVGQARGSGGSGGGREVGRSRKGKRKVDDVDEEGEDRGEGNGVDGEEVSEDEEMQQETPPKSHDEETEDEEDLDAPNIRAEVDGGKGKGKGKGGRGTRGKEMKVGEDMEEDLEPPPRRELPVGLRGSTVTKPAERPAAATTSIDDDDDDETDDEL